MISQVIGKCPKAFERLLYQNIVLTGGNTKFGGFKERVETELQSLKPQDCELNVEVLDNATSQVWRGLRDFCDKRSSLFEQHVVTRKEYHEEGPRISKKFYL